MPLARRSASVSPEKRSTASTGPKISSRAIVIDSVTPVTSVGASQKPCRKDSPCGAQPPVSTCAPSLTACSTIAISRARCAADCTGPICVPASRPLPTTMRAMRAASRSTKASCTVSSTSSREPAEQTWPAWKKAASSARSTAMSRSASAKTMLGFLPPSSSATRLKLLSAAAFMM